MLRSIKRDRRAGITQTLSACIAAGAAEFTINSKCIRQLSVTFCVCARLWPFEAFATGRWCLCEVHQIHRFYIGIHFHFEFVRFRVATWNHPDDTSVSTPKSFLVHSLYSVEVIWFNIWKCCMLHRWPLAIVLTCVRREKETEWMCVRDRTQSETSIDSQKHSIIWANM